MVTTAAVGAGLATTTYNVDVHSIFRRYNRMVQEACKSQSSGLSQTIGFDMARFKSYVDAIDKFIDFVTSMPILDCPETGPTEIPLPAPVALPAIENESIYDLMQLVDIARTEVANSQSGRLPTNMHPADKIRQKAYLSKMVALLTYIEGVEPLDLPESSPSVAMSGPGDRGV